MRAEEKIMARERVGRIKLWMICAMVGATVLGSSPVSHAADPETNTSYVRIKRLPAHSPEVPAEVASPRIRLGPSDSTMARIAQIFDKADFMYGIDWYKTKTEGNRTRSFKPDNVFQLHNASIGYREKFGEVAFDFQTALRWTDDFTITRSEDYKIQSLHANFERAEKWGLRLGDIFPNLSPYTFTRSARYGGHGWYRTPFRSGHVKVSAALGVTNREQEFTRGTEAGQYRRYASGASIDWEGDGPGPIGKVNAGFRSSSVTDDASSIKSRYGLSNAPIPKIDIAVHSFRYDAALPAGFTLKGENAYSNGTRDMTVTSPVHRYGLAHNSALDWKRPSEWGAPGRLARVLPVSMRADFEWVDPDFLTELGSASVDQFRWGANTDHRWSDALDWTLSFVRNQDNVKKRIRTGTVPVTNISKTSTFRSNMRPFELSSGIWKAPQHLRDLRYGFEFRHGDQDATNATSNRKTEDYSHTLDYKNWNINWNADYKIQLTDDDVAPNNDKRVDDWGIRASRSFTYSIWEVKITPTASYRHSVDKTLRGENLSRTQTGNFGLGVAQGEFNLQTGVTLTDLDRNAANSDVLNKTYTATLGFKPLFAPAFSMNFSLRHSDVEEENKGNSYQQTEGRAHVDVRF